MTRPTPLRPAIARGAHRARQRGITLFELFVVVAVASVLAAIAVPNMSEFIKNNARAARMNSLVTALNFARSEAVARRPTTRNTRVCVSSDNATCTAGDGNAFEVGFIVQREEGGPPNPWVWTLRRAFQPEGGNFTLRGDEADGTDVTQVEFDPSGRATGLGTRVRFTYCDDRGAAEARAIVLTGLGQPRTSTDETGDGIHDVSDGVNSVNLTCP